MIVGQPGVEHGGVDGRRLAVAALQPALQGGAQAVEADRLGEVAIHAGLAAALVLAGHGVGGHRDDRRATTALGRLEAADLRRHLEAIHPGHVNVGEHDRVVAALPGLQALDAVGGRIGGDAERQELAHQHLAIDGMVVDHQHRTAGRRWQGHRRVALGRKRRQVDQRRIGRRRHQVERDGEGRAGAGRALDRDVPAHELRQAADDRQAEASAAVASRGRAVGLGERLEEPRLLRLAHADAGVADRQDDTGAAFAQRLGAGADHGAAALGELQRIAQQVEQDLAHPGRIADQRVGRAGRRGGHQRQALALGLRAQRGDDAVDQAGQRERRFLELEPAGLDLGEIEQIVDDPQQRLRGLAHGGQRAPLALAQALGLQHLHHAQHAVHRRPDLVAHRGEEGRLRLVGRLCLGARLLGRGERLLELALSPALLGNVADDDDGPPIGLVAHRDAGPLLRTVEDHRGMAGPQRRQDARGPAFRGLARWRGPEARGMEHGIGQGGAGRDELGRVAHDAAIGFVAEHQSFVGIEEGDRRDQAGMGLCRLVACRLELALALLDVGEIGDQRDDAAFPRRMLGDPDPPAVARRHLALAERCPVVRHHLGDPVLAPACVLGADLSLAQHLPQHLVMRHAAHQQAGPFAADEGLVGVVPHDDARVRVVD